MRNSADMITVCVVDDHPFFRDGVSRGLTQSGEIRVVGEAEDGRSGLDLIRAESPAVAVVDYQMPNMNGLELTKAVVRDKLPTRILLLSAVTDGSVVFQALEEGAQGYLSKDASRNEIIGAVRDIAAGRKVVPPNLTAALVDQIRMRSERSAPILSQREREVLVGFAAGKSIPQIAKELFLGASTVKTHTERLYDKLGVSDRAAAVAEAMRQGLLE